MVAEFVEVAKDLRFPEGQVALPDGSVVLVEMMGRCITRIMPDGTKQTVAEIAGGPNGLAHPQFRQQFALYRQAIFG